MSLVSEGPTGCQFSMHMVLFFAKLPWSFFANLTFLNNQQMASVWAIISWCLAMADSRGGMGLVRGGGARCPRAERQVKLLAFSNWGWRQ